MRIGEAAAGRLIALTEAADAAAQNNLGVVLQRGGRADDAARAFGRAIALDAGMSVARRNLRALPASTLAAAVDARWARVRADATDADAWRALVRQYAARGDFAAAAAVIDRWDASTTDHAPALLERARCALDAGDPAAALEALERLRHSSGVGPDVAAALDLLEARAAYQRGDAARALAAVERARAAVPHDAELELLRSFVLGELGETGAAIASRARAERLDPALARLDPGVAGHAGPAEAFDSAREIAPGSVVGRRGPEDSELALAVALRQKGYLREATRALSAATASGDPIRRAAALQAAGVLHLLQGDAAAAVASLRVAVDELPDDVADRAGPTLALSAAHLLAGDLDAADATAGDVLTNSATALARAGAANVRALVAWRRHDLPSAHRHLVEAAREARQLGGAQADAVRGAFAANLALLLSAAAAPAAVAAGAAAVRLAPNDPAAHVAYARALSEAGDHAHAREAFARACALAPDDAAARYGLAFAAGACGDAGASRLELARAAAVSAVVRGPVPRVVVDADGAVFLAGDGAGATTAGAPCDQDASSDEPSEGSAYAHVDARLAAGDYDRALAAADVALGNGAPAAGGHVRAGHALARSGRASLALARYERAADADLADPALEMHVLRTLHGLGRYEEACARAEAGLARWPDASAIMALLARAAADRGNVEGAAQALDRCARTPRAGGPADEAAFWADVACAWQGLGVWDAAAAAWAAASRAVPTLPSLALARARALARAGHADRAEALLQELARAAPGLADVWRARADVALSAGRLPAARAHLARVVGGDAGDADALAALAAACADTGRFDRAATAAARALAVDAEHPLALAVRGDCEAAGGDQTTAREYWKSSLAAAPVGAGAARARRGLRHGPNAVAGAEAGATAIGAAA